MVALIKSILKLIVLVLLFVSALIFIGITQAQS